MSLATVLFEVDSDAQFHVGPSNPAQVRGAGVLRSVVEARAGGGVVRWIGLERCDGFVEAPRDHVVPIAKEAHGARPSEERVIVLQLDLVAVVLPDPEIELAAGSGSWAE
jgi:hypothetical protein